MGLRGLISTNAAIGKVEKWAGKIIREVDSYTECSPSAEGCHILAKGSLPPEGRRKGRVEMYDSDRYFTVTGNHLLGTPLTVEACDLTALHARMVAGELDPPAPKNGKASGTNGHDKALTTFRSRPTLDQLMAGELTYGPDGDYDSRSEADIALCNRLAFKYQGDAAMMDAEFRK